MDRMELQTKKIELQDLLESLWNKREILSIQLSRALFYEERKPCEDELDLIIEQISGNQKLLRAVMIILQKESELN